jgi:hypothetical protein
VGIRVSEASALELINGCLPFGWRPADSPVVGSLYSLILGGPTGRPGRRRFHVLYRDWERVTRTLDREELFRELASNLDFTVAQHASERVFVHAGVVVWRGRAMLLPGRSLSGKTTLVAGLVRAGATYYSDEFAVFDREGLVHPYPRPLHLREPGSVTPGRPVAIEHLGAAPGSGPARVGLVVKTSYAANARWVPTRLSPAIGLLHVLDNTAVAQTHPELALPVLAQALRHAVVLSGARGEAEETAVRLLAALEEPPTPYVEPVDVTMTPDQESHHRRFLLYDVNPAEGFNLRRDVMIRAALLTRQLGPQWTLVLPPFPSMRHWRSERPGRLFPWSRFFEVSELAKVVDVVEYEDYASRHGREVELVLHLILDRSDLRQPYRIRPVACPPLDDVEPGTGASAWSMRAFGDDRPLRAGRLECRAVLAPYSSLAPELAADPAASILLNRFETAFWGSNFGDAEYWRVRSRLVFAQRLRDEAARFVDARLAGRPYLSVHLRRGDFESAGRNPPLLEEVAEQVQRLRAARGLEEVFLATDASAEELETLRRQLDFVLYRPRGDEEWLDGEVAIVEQLIAAGGTVFIGTATSTFSGVIREEREIRGLSADSTWNVLSRPRGEGARRVYDCSEPARWPYVGARRRQTQ